MIKTKPTSLMEAARSLTDRERRVIQLRFVECMSLEQAGRDIRVTRERVRQIQGRAFRKLRGWMW